MCRRIAAWGASLALCGIELVLGIDLARSNDSTNSTRLGRVLLGSCFACGVGHREGPWFVVPRAPQSLGLEPPLRATGDDLTP